MKGWVAALWGAPLWLAACRSPGPAPEPAPEAGEAAAPLRGWHYAVALDPALEQMDVEVCFEGRRPDWFIPGRPDSAHVLDYARIKGGDRLRRQKNAIDLREMGAGECLEYGIDLDELTETGGRKAQREGDSVVARPSTWLWRPDELPDGADVTLRFEMPAGQAVSVPWPLHDEGPRSASSTYRLTATAFNWLGYSVFGTVDVVLFEHAGCAFEIVTLDAPFACSDRGLRSFIEDAADSVAMLYGDAFPRETMQVVVVPVDGRGGSVYFGMAGRGGGSGVYLLIDDEVHGPELPGGWTTVHEMLHHGMPFVDDAWMAEGWVSYYTEVMRTRMGHRDEAEGWAKLAEAFDRGGRGGRGLTLRETSDSMHETFAYQRVYWGGAAIGFLIDIALRRDSGGKKSLDDAMRELRTCCGDARHRWPAADLLRHLDEWYGKPVFTETAAEHLDGIAFPEVDEAMAGLGVTLHGDGTATLDDAHPDAALRRGIMAPRRPVSQ